MPASILYRRATDTDYSDMIRLQEDNLLQNLSKEQLADGFLATRYESHQFKRINTELAIVVAVADTKVVGYLCAKCFSYAVEFPVLRALINHMTARRVNNVSINAETTFIYGPVCVAREVRGKGVVAGMWKTMQEIAATRYKAAILFIADTNIRSLRAHEKLGMQQYGMFEQGGNRYYALATTL
jgi:L-amino acid N-acyltransferase YncA